MKKIFSFTFTAVLFLFCSSCIVDPNAMPPSFSYSDPNYRIFTQKLPQTTALDKELRQIHKSLTATTERTKKAKTTVTNGRYAAEAAVKMIDQIPPVEKQVSRLERELSSISKIPQFKLLKPVAKAMTGLKGKVKTIKERAESLRDKKIKPSIKKMKSLEAKLTKLNSGLNLASHETVSAVRNVNLLRNFVISNKYPAGQVNALEALSKTTRYPVSPAQKALNEFDSACTDLENLVNTYKSMLVNLSKLKPGLEKVKTKMKPIDDKMKSIAKVLDKKLEFKIPLSKGKKVSFSVRQVIETPGKILDIAVKPLTKIDFSIFVCQKLRISGRFYGCAISPPRIRRRSRFAGREPVAAPSDRGRPRGFNGRGQRPRHLGRASVDGPVEARGLCRLFRLSAQRGRDDGGAGRGGPHDWPVAVLPQQRCAKRDRDRLYLSGARPLGRGHEFRDETADGGPYLCPSPRGLVPYRTNEHPIPEGHGKTGGGAGCRCGAGPWDWPCRLGADGAAA